MKVLVALLSFFLLLQSCASLEEPEYRGQETFKLESVEGKKVAFLAGATIYNPNGFAIKIKPSKFEVFVENDRVGTVQLEKKVKLKKKSESVLSAPFSAELIDGALLKAMKQVGKQEVSIRLKGKAKAGVFLFSKKMDVDRTINVPTKTFGSGGLKIPGLN